jgi:hypothetical protein
MTAPITMAPSSDDGVACLPSNLGGEHSPDSGTNKIE